MSLNFVTKYRDPYCWSLTFRLVLFFTAAMAVILSGMSGLLYSELVNNIYSKDKAELKRSVKIQQEIVEKLERNKIPDIWAEEWRKYIDRTDHFALRIITPDGKVFSESPNMFAPHDDFPKASDEFPMKHWKTPKHYNEHFLITSIPVEMSNHSKWIIEGALETTKSHELIENYRNKLFIFSAIAIFISGMASWVLARYGLTPVRAISAEISRINAEKLNLRIGHRRWPSDLQDLTKTVDTMLSRLEGSFEQLTRFSSDIAHEFRSPINNLVAAASVTLAHDRDVGDYKETLAVVVEEGERLSRMVSSMLFLARVENAQQALHIEQLSAKSEFEKVRDFFEALAEERQVKLTISGDCNITADPLLLRRALSNLISNALQHTPANGEIFLYAQEENNGVVLSVADTGKGISPEHLPHIFDRFYRSDVARSSNESTGLGLAIVKSIAELHGGWVKVNSMLNAGSCFTLFFPTTVFRSDLNK